MTRFIAILLFLAAPYMAEAQPRVDVFWRSDAPADRLLDFGVTLVGFPVARTITIVNRDVQPVSVPFSVEPFFIVTNDPSTGAQPNDPNKEEFVRITGLPVEVPPGEERTVRIDFLAFANQPLLPPDVVNQALLRMRVVYANDVQGAGYDAEFTLRGLKTRSIIASTTTRIDFDSVYVAPRPAAPVRSWVVQNVIDRTIPVLEQTLELLSSSTGGSEFDVEVYPTASFGPKGSLAWDVRYAPINRGVDSAQFFIVYRPQPSASPDSVKVRIYGVGVEQRLDILGAQGSPTPVRVAGDTIDFGDVDAVAGSCTATVIVRNTGNLTVHPLSETVEGTPRDVAAFQLDQPISNGAASVGFGREDTLVLTFRPTAAGQYAARYVLNTDLRSRAITGVPDGAQDISFVLVGRGRRPQIELSTTSVDFGNIVLFPNCDSEKTRQIEIRNLGNTELRIDSVTAEIADDVLLASPQSLRIQPAGKATLMLVFGARRLGARTASLFIHTNADARAFTVAIGATVVAPDTTVFRLPERIRARPGNVVEAAIAVTGASVSKADRVAFVLAYDPTLMRFKSVIITGTASAGATIQSASEVLPGRLLVELSAPATFDARDTLVRLIFDTFLGARAATEITVVQSGARFGSAGCSDVLGLRTHSGSFELDSTCGLDYKTVSSTGVRLEMWPNPSSGAVTVDIDLTRPMSTEVLVMDAQGRVVKHLGKQDFPAGRTTVFLHLDGCPPGVYAVSAIAEGRRASYSLVLLP